MGYLAPPPMPAPVVVTKDVGGFVSDYEAQTAIYRASGREVRIHECRSACTLALGLPNVCVYPDSVLKFHQAYDPDTRQPDFQVSQQLFDSYPAAVRARLGSLTRNYKILRGSELIELGIRNCNEPRVMTAAAAPRKAPAQVPRPGGDSFLAGLMDGVLTAFGQTAVSSGPPRDKLAVAPGTVAKAAPFISALAEIPEPPPKPNELGMTGEISSAQQAGVTYWIGAAEAMPPRGPEVSSRSSRPLGSDAPRVMSGAQPILPARFTAFSTVRSS